MFEEIGLFGDFFMPSTDLGWRARLSKWKTYYVPEAVGITTTPKNLGLFFDEGFSR
jgi:hypothetical protein